MQETFVERIIKQRDKKVIECYERGDRIEMIEAFFGITKQRIYQILDKHKIAKTRYKKKLSTDDK